MRSEKFLRFYFSPFTFHLSPNNGMQIQVGIITISDRASAGQYDDLGGPALKDAAQKNGWQILAEALVPDDTARI